MALTSDKRKTVDGFLVAVDKFEVADFIFLQGVGCCQGPPGVVGEDG